MNTAIKGKLKIIARHPTRCNNLPRLPVTAQTAVLSPTPCVEAHFEFSAWIRTASARAAEPPTALKLICCIVDKLNEDNTAVWSIANVAGDRKVAT